MIKTKDEILTAIKERIGDDTSDSALSLIEDVTDTFTDYESKVNGDGTDWKTKYEENDATWRQRYRDRFFEGSNDDKTPPGADPKEEPEKPPVTFNDLFIEKEK